MMSHILPKRLGKQLAVLAGWCLLVLITAPLAADELDDGRTTSNVSPWGPISFGATFGSLEANLQAALIHEGSHVYAEIDYGRSDTDLGGANVDLSYWSLGLRGYPVVAHGVGGSPIDIAVFVGAGLGWYDVDSLTDAQSGFTLRAGFEIRHHALLDWGLEAQWLRHQIDIAGPDLEFDDVLVGIRFHLRGKKD